MHSVLWQIPDWKHDVPADLHDKLKFENIPSSLVPDALSVNQKSQRRSNSKIALTALMEHKLTDFEQIITGDESWSLRYYSRDSVWETSRDDLPHRITQMTKQKNDRNRFFGQ
jgi:hypothetical protein